MCVFKQHLRVNTGELDGDEFGNEWALHYVLYESEDDEEVKCYDLYTDDGAGNGSMVARGYNLTAMRAMALKLGEFVEWGVK